MIISELIKELDAIKAKHGDLLVVTTDYGVPLTVQDVRLDDVKELLFGLTSESPADFVRKPLPGGFTLRSFKVDYFPVGKLEGLE